MIRVLLVDDSALMRNVLRELIEASGDISVAGEASNGLSGCERIEMRKVAARLPM